MFTYNRSENAADELSAPGEAADGPAIRALGQERPQGIQQVRRPARKGSALCAALHSQPVTITYQTHVPEEMYDSGTSLGSNAAWFTFDYKGASRSTPVTELPVGSGDGSGTPGTATLVKSNSGYDAAHRTTEWIVKINPHQAYLKGGTFTDRLDSVGPRCTAGHGSGLELVGDVKDIDVTVNGRAPAPEEAALLDLEYDRQVLTVKVGEIGAKTIALTFTTRVCDPCVFANNRQNVPFTNTISTDDMLIGSQASVGRSASADSTAKADGQTLTVKLGTVAETTAVTFDTRVDPEALGFGGDKPVVVENTVCMNGSADGVIFAEVFDSVGQSFSNHGLVKRGDVDNRDELIRYEVLINPFGLALPERPALVDTLDKRLQLDADSLRFCEAEVSGTTETGKDQRRPGHPLDGRFYAPSGCGCAAFRAPAGGCDGVSGVEVEKA